MRFYLFILLVKSQASLCKFSTEMRHWWMIIDGIVSVIDNYCDFRVSIVLLNINVFSVLLLLVNYTRILFGTSNLTCAFKNVLLKHKIRQQSISVYIILPLHVKKDYLFILFLLYLIYYFLLLLFFPFNSNGMHQVLNFLF